MQSGMQFTRPIEPSEDEYIDEEGNLVHLYAIEDEPHLMTPMVAVEVVGRTPNRRREGQGEGRGRRRPTLRPDTQKCSKCGQVGHNVRTCPRLRAPQQEEAEPAIPNTTFHIQPTHEGPEQEECFEEEP